jgi:proline iminopeptidase
LFSVLLCAACAGSNGAKKGDGQTAAAEESEVPAGEVTLHVRRVGPRGDTPLVLLHGGPGLSSGYLQGLEKLASSGRSVVLYDQRGDGRSTAPSPNDAAHYVLDKQVEDLEAVRKSLGAEKLLLGGHSWGGIVAMAYTAAHPDRVAALLLLNSAPPHWDGLQAALAKFTERQKQLAGQGLISATPPPPQGDDCMPGERAIMPIYFADPHHVPVKDWSPATCHSKAQELAFGAVEKFDLRPALQGWTGRTLVLGGSDEPFTKEMQETVLASLPKANVQKVVLDHCGHVPWWDCKDAFFSQVQSFLDGTK